MPNWCFTQYAITGNTEQLNELYTIMEKLQNMEKPLVENGFGTKWLGCLVERLGASSDSINCRGAWSDLKKDDKSNVHFVTETAWHRMDEVETVIQEKWNEIKIFYCEEESGCEIYNTNDKDGLFFPERFIIDDESNEMDYYTLENALLELTEIFGQPVTSWQQGLDLAEERNEKADEDNTETHVWLHEIIIEE